MSVPNLTNSMMQSQNIVLNQVPLSHAIMTNVSATNGIPIATALAHTTVDQNVEMKQATGIVEAVPIIGGGVVGVQTIQAPIVTTQPPQPQPQQVVQKMQITSTSESGQMITKQRLQDVVRDTDPTMNLEEEVEELLLQYIDHFIDRLLNGAALIAKNRRINSVEVKDVQQYLNRNYNMWTPGFGTDELRPYKRSLTTEAHKQRLALIRKTLKKY